MKENPEVIMNLYVILDKQSEVETTTHDLVLTREAERLELIAERAEKFFQTLVAILYVAHLADPGTAPPQTQQEQDDHLSRFIYNFDKELAIDIPELTKTYLLRNRTGQQIRNAIVMAKRHRSAVPERLVLTLILCYKNVRNGSSGQELLFKSNLPNYFYIDF